MTTETDGQVDFSLTGDRSATCSARVKPKRALHEEIATFNIPENIAFRAAEICNIIANSRIYRELPRRQLAFFGTYYAFLEDGKTYDPILLGIRMNLRRNEVVRAFTMYSTSPNYKVPVVICKPSNFVVEYCKIFNFKNEDCSAISNYVTKICLDIPELLEFNPCKTAAALIYIYCFEHNIKIEIDEEHTSMSKHNYFATMLCLTSGGLQSARKWTQEVIDKSSNLIHDSSVVKHKIHSRTHGRGRAKNEIIKPPTIKKEKKITSPVNTGKKRGRPPGSVKKK